MFYSFFLIIYPNPPCQVFPCGRTWRKPTTFGSVLTNSSHVWSDVRYRARTHDLSGGWTSLRRLSHRSPIKGRSLRTGSHNSTQQITYRWRQCPCLSAFTIYSCIAQKMAHLKSLESQFRFICPLFASINSNCALRYWLLLLWKS